jgi:hypothetical protein
MSEDARPEREGTKEQWNELPGHVKGAVGWVVVGAIIGLLTQNVLLAVVVAGVTAVFAFVRPTLEPGVRGSLTFAIVPFLLAAAFATAHVHAAAPVPGGPDGWTPAVYDCGMVVQHPFVDPTQAWKDEDASQINTGMEHAGDHGNRK